MKFGLLYEMETPRPWHALSEYNVYWEALAQIELADRIGIDYVWEVEHHFLEEYSHSPAPEVFYGAVTQRTRNIRIAHLGAWSPSRFRSRILPCGWRAWRRIVTRWPATAAWACSASV